MFWNVLKSVAVKKDRAECGIYEVDFISRQLVQTMSWSPRYSGGTNGAVENYLQYFTRRDENLLEAQLEEESPYWTLDFEKNVKDTKKTKTILASWDVLFIKRHGREVSQATRMDAAFNQESYYGLSRLSGLPHKTWEDSIFPKETFETLQLKEEYGKFFFLILWSWPPQFDFQSRHQNSL